MSSREMAQALRGRRRRSGSRVGVELPQSVGEMVEIHEGQPLPSSHFVCDLKIGGQRPLWRSRSTITRHCTMVPGP